MYANLSNYKYPNNIERFLSGENPDIKFINKPLLEKTEKEFFYLIIVSLASIFISIVLFHNNEYILAIIAFGIGIVTFLVFLGAVQNFSESKKKNISLYEIRLNEYNQLIDNQKALQREIDSYKIQNSLFRKKN